MTKKFSDFDVYPLRSYEKVVDSPGTIQELEIYLNVEIYNNCIYHKSFGFTSFKSSESLFIDCETWGSTNYEIFVEKSIYNSSGKCLVC